MSARPHAVVVIPRGEAIRNFLYSRALPELAKSARVTVLSVVTDESIMAKAAGTHVEAVVPLREHAPPRAAAYLRALAENVHDRRLWSEVAKNNWELRDRRAQSSGRTWRRRATKMAARALSQERTLRALTRLEQSLSYRLRPTREFDELFERLRPDLVFNGSHIHGSAGELPTRVAHRMGIKTAGFIFSWDNLTSRSRIFVPYDRYLVWHEGMKRQLLEIYPHVRPEQVRVTGTPQFDFHFDEGLALSKEDLASRIGLDPARPFILYTTGISNHFFEEHRHVEAVIRILDALDLSPRPQLVVRTYVKGTSPEMRDLASRSLPDVIFPEVLWEPTWQTPLFEDLKIYSGLLKHCALGINAASTVTLELLLFDKPVINLDFDPPGSSLPWCEGYERHILFDHYRPVAKSGAVMVARSVDDLREMVRAGLLSPEKLCRERRALLRRMFGSTLDGRSGERVAASLLAIATGRE